MMKLVNIINSVKNFFIKTDMKMDYDTGYDIANHNFKRLLDYKKKIDMDNDKKYCFLLTFKEKEDLNKGLLNSEEFNKILKLRWLEIVNDMIFFFEYSLSPSKFINEDDKPLKKKKNLELLEKRYKRGGNYFIVYFRELWD